LIASCAKGAKTFAVGELNKLAPTLEILDQIKNPCLIFFEPPSIDERIINQYSLSSVMPGVMANPEEWLKAHRKLCEKIIIPSEIKSDIRDALDQSNLTERVFFPSLDGLSDWLVRYYGLPTREKNPKPKLVYRGKHLHFYGGKGCWEYVSRAKTTHGVAVIALTDEGRLVLVRQRRVPLDKEVIELPAGLVEGISDASIIAAARRELREETGFRCTTEPKLIYKGAALPGTTNEINAFCLAESVRFPKRGDYFVLEEGGVRRHKQRRGIVNEGENITVYEVPIGYVGKWLERQIQTGNIVDIKVYAALSFLKSRN
jgi:NTP pyrophosphohydrolases including oxidative damage repair enzymes